MISARAVWRLVMLPVYMLIAGAVFALALRNTAGSILSPLASLAPWAMLLAGILALLSIIGGLLRWRRRLAAVRHGHPSRARECPQRRVHEWENEPDAQPAARS
ncbi:hypothetical protein CNR27_07675 [Luteimonas chenhongjianii]|uniref:Uncharacterized protein n=1 Tax=Luteimonas chenhongjianii TaxID=2006110 RepID=A0A290XDW9_9GAMM|nr:hypothetical protein [Luteimonas chenhongjianii]ATD67330.1 hypothetical protein CNR27_07675 [Luteimonas chenhongjianii]